MKPLLVAGALLTLTIGYAQTGDSPGAQSKLQIISDPDPTDPVQVLEDHPAERFLDQATWGPTPAGIQHLQRIGIHRWLRQQFQVQPSDLPDQPLLDATGKTNTEDRKSVV